MKKNATEKNAIAFVREAICLQQEQLALYLSVPRSTISMAECGQRSLNSAAETQLAKLMLEIINLPTVQPQLNVLDEAEQTELHKYLKRQVELKQHKCKKLESRLDRLKNMRLALARQTQWMAQKKVMEELSPQTSEWMVAVSNISNVYCGAASGLAIAKLEIEIDELKTFIEKHQH